MEAVLELESKALTVQEEGAQLVVKSVAGMATANRYIQEVIRPMLALVEEKLGTPKVKAWDSYQSSLKLYKEYHDPLVALEKDIKGKIGTCDEELRDAARREQARLEEIARKEREAEQAKADKKIAALMEKAGGMQEQIDALKAEIEASSNVMEIEKMERQVEILTRKMEAAQVKAAEVQVQAEQAYEMPAPVIQAKPQVQGMSTRQIPELISVDIVALARAVVEQKMSTGVLDYNGTAILALIKAGMGENLKKAGVQYRMKTVVSTKS